MSDAFKKVGLVLGVGFVVVKVYQGLGYLIQKAILGETSDSSGDDLSDITQSERKLITEKLAGEYGAIIRRNALEYNLEPDLIAAIIWRESSGNPHQLGSSGEIGIMQVIPSTNTAINRRYNDNVVHVTNKFPEVSIKQGSRYLRMMLDTFDNDYFKAIQAYNAGPGNVINDTKKDVRKKYIDGVINRLTKIRKLKVF